MSDILQLSDRQKRLYASVYDGLCAEMRKMYEQNRDKTFSIFLSGGYDSRFVLYMCKDLNIPIQHCYTFSLQDRMSTDAKLAVEVCCEEDVDCITVFLPTDAETVIETMEILAKDFGCQTKTDFECSFPLYYLYANCDEDMILTGTDADCYFALGRSYGLHYKHLPDGLAKFRYDMFNGRANGQLLQRRLLAEKYHKTFFDPFFQYSVREIFEGTTWEELNVPYKKGPLYAPYKDKYDSIKPYRSSYQCGDSGVRELCADILLHPKYNTGNYTSVVGCYNQLVRRFTDDRNTPTLF